MVTGGMEAQDHLGTWRTFDSPALCADGNTTIGADFQGSAKAPNIGPPRATWGWTQNGAFFFFGQIPGLLGDQAQFTMGFLSVAMEA